MSEMEQFPDSECGRALSWMPALADGDLAPDQEAWLQTHAESCDECRAALAGFREMDAVLTGWGERIVQENPARSGARERLAASLRESQPRRRASGWTLAAATAVAAALAIALMAPARKLPAPAQAAAGPSFIEIPYVAPLDPNENATIVRMNLSVSTLIEVGYRVTADPATIVPAEVLVGEDGRAHAVRVLSDIDWSKTGD